MLMCPGPGNFTARIPATPLRGGVRVSLSRTTINKKKPADSRDLHPGWKRSGPAQFKGRLWAPEARGRCSSWSHCHLDRDRSRVPNDGGDKRHCSSGEYTHAGDNPVKIGGSHWRCALQHLPCRQHMADKVRHRSSCPCAEWPARSTPDGRSSWAVFFAPRDSRIPQNRQLLPLSLYGRGNSKERSSRNPYGNPCQEHGVGLAGPSSLSSAPLHAAVTLAGRIFVPPRPAPQPELRDDVTVCRVGFVVGHCRCMVRCCVHNSTWLGWICPCSARHSLLDYYFYIDF